MMASLTGLDVSNASMYDGATATAEAMMMAVAASRKRSRVLVSATVNPAVRTVAATYARYHKICLDTIPATEDGITDLEAMYAMLDGGDVAGVILPSPNYYGIIEDFTGVADRIHAAKALMIMNCKASSLAVLRTPWRMGGRYSSRRCSEPGYAAELRRPVPGLPLLHRSAHAQDAGPHCRCCYGRQPRPKGVCPDVAGTGTAYTPR